MLLVSRQLYYFIITAEMHSLKDAASRLCITPSPLGRSLANLESELGVRLFYRSADGISLTPQGEQLYRSVYPVYQQLAQLKDRFHDNEKPRCPPLRVATDGLATGFSTIFADKLTALTPPRYLQMQELSVKEIASSLRRQTIDMGIVSDPLTDERGLYRHFLLEEPIKLAVPQEFSSQNVIRLMEAYPLAQNHMAPDNGHIKRIHAWYDLLGISPDILRFTEMSQRLYMVEQGLAVSLVPASTAHNIPDNIVLMDLPDGSPSVRRYVYCLLERYSNLKDPLALLESSMRY